MNIAYKGHIRHILYSYSVNCSTIPGTYLSPLFLEEIQLYKTSTYTLQMNILELDVYTNNTYHHSPAGP